MHEQLSPLAAKRPSKLAPACPATALRSHSHPPTSIAANLKWLAKVLWLFTKTDIHNLVLPACTMNLVIHSLFSSVSHVSYLAMLVSAIKTFVWGYLGLLVIDVTNQLTGMDEDKLNKPFRPLPAGLISVPGAMRLAVIAACMFVLVADGMGVLWCALSFVAATSTYNFTGTDKHWLGKNLCNAWGYGCYFAAGGWIAWWDIAKSVGIENAADLLDDVALAVRCLTLLHSATILATITIQDLRDVDGDLQSHRSTQNLAVGEWPARIQIVVCMSVATVLGATRSWKVAGYHVLKALGLCVPAAAPVWEGMATWSVGSAAYYSALSALVAWVGWRIMHDCPTYAIVALDVGDGNVKLISKWTDVASQAKRLGVKAPRTATSSGDMQAGVPAARALNETGEQYDSGVFCDHAVDTAQWECELKRAQYQHDDASFKLYILWLYLYIYTAVF